jgi:antitoxin ParD1/3/4
MMYVLCSYFAHKRGVAVMNVNFPPVDEGYIKAKVADGFYSNATELVRDAVRRLREQDDRDYASLIAALELGEQDIRESRVSEYTPGRAQDIAREVMDQAERDGRLSDNGHP